MNRFLTAVFIAVGLMAPPVSAQSLTGSAQDWVGGYYGLSLGMVRGDNLHSWNGRLGGRLGVDVEVDGAAFGLLYGRNYAVGNTVLGFETDINWATADGFNIGVSTPCVTPGEACNNELNGFATLRGRFGVPFGNGLLPYVTAGFAAGNVRGTADTGACRGFPCTLDETRIGWVGGMGMEGALDNGWSFRAEILHLDFGDEIMDGSALFTNVRAEYQYDMLRIALVHRF